MKFLRRFFIRLSNLATGRSADQRLQDEIAEHLAFQTEENLRAGMAPAEARRQAVLKFGAVQAMREKYHAEEGLPLENLLQNSRYTLRMLKSPGFAAHCDCDDGSGHWSDDGDLQRGRRHAAASVVVSGAE